jgi:recombination protein RecT
MSVTNAVATRDNSPSSLIQQYKADFATVLPSHVKPDTWVRLATGALRRDPKLLEAATNNPASLMSALLHAARLGLEPGTEQYYLTPRRNKDSGPEVLGIVGYQGEIELMYRAGAVSAIIVEVVRQADRFEYSPGRHDRPVHEIDWDADDRGPLRLVYAYAVMKDGATSKVVVLNKHHIAAARASSQGSDKPYSPWQKHEEAMWLKTAAHRLRKWVPTSAEYRSTVQASAAQALDVEQRRELPAPASVRVDTSTGEVIDSEVVADHPFVYDEDDPSGACMSCGLPEDAAEHAP